ncbi:hypothetical protein RB195_014210 [Necator americanus]|uniref:Uncharacterized protein n=1 Tax=Necator americanus TaxID=51031 RepID=A0ABR1E0M9_NECAM
MPQRVRKDSASSTTKRTVAEENHLAGVLSKEGIASGNDGDSSAGKKPLTDPIPFNHSTLEGISSRLTRWVTIRPIKPTTTSTTTTTMTSKPTTTTTSTTTRTTTSTTTRTTTSTTTRTTTSTTTRTTTLEPRKTRTTTRSTTTTSKPTTTRATAKTTTKTTIRATTSKPTKASTSIRTPQRTRRPTTEAEPEPEPEPDPDDGLPVLPPLPTTRPKKVTSTTRRITDGDPGPSEEKETSTTEATSVWQGGSTRSEGLIIGPSDIRGKQPRKYKHMNNGAVVLLVCGIILSLLLGILVVLITMMMAADKKEGTKSTKSTKSSKNVPQLPQSPAAH